MSRDRRRNICEMSARMLRGTLLASYNSCPLSEILLPSERATDIRS